jgi:hypothetical protein
MMSEMPLAVSLDSRRRGHLGGQIRLVHVHIRKVTSPEIAEVVATPRSHFGLVNGDNVLAPAIMVFNGEPDIHWSHLCIPTCILALIPALLRLLSCLGHNFCVVFEFFFCAMYVIQYIFNVYDSKII